MPSAGGHRAERADKIIGSRVAHYADGLDWQQHRKGLPNFVIKAAFADFVEINDVGGAQDFEFFAGHFARNTDREPRPGKGMTADKGRRHLRRKRPTRPSARTSSLNNSRNGSTSLSFIVAGNPPTL